MKTHEKKWEDQGGCLFLIEMVFVGDTFKMKDLLGFSFKNHYLINKKGSMSYYANKETVKKAKEFGKKRYSDISFIEGYKKKISEVQKGLKQVTKIIKKEDLSKKDNISLFNLYTNFFEKYSNLIGLYRFSRPEFYDDIIKDIIDKFPEPKEENFNLFLSHNKDFGLDSNTQELAKKLNEIGKIRLDMHKVWQDTFNDFEVMFKEISSRTSLSILDVKNCLSSETKDLLLNNKNPDLNEIKKRINFYNFIYKEDRFEIDFEKDLADKTKTEVDKIKGTIAYHGKVTGKVKVILNSISRSSEENKEIEPNSILVTGNTAPDLVPVIKKVVAIVTDEGGLLSHAATVAREFKKPTIIGTKIATKIFKDNDLIEVDANKGIVRKIK